MTREILVIENDEIIYSKIKNALEDLNIKITVTDSIDEAIRIFMRNALCLIILNATISYNDEHRLIKMMRVAKPIPILILSPREKYPDRIDAFQAGAVAYLGKSYKFEELVAQIRSMIDLYTELMPSKAQIHTFAFGMDIIIDPRQRQVFINSKSIKLTRKEFDLLLCLATHAGQVLSREQLYNQIWNYNLAYNIDDTVKSHIKTLRKKLSKEGVECIETVWGIGYRFNLKTVDR